MDSVQQPRLDIKFDFEFDLEFEKNVLGRLAPMVDTVWDMRNPAINLPLDKAPFRIEPTDRHTFNPLGSADFAILKESADDDLKERCLAAPRHLGNTDALVQWANPVAHACRELTSIRNRMWKSDDGAKIHCAGFSESSFNPKNESQRILLRGERRAYNPRAPMWFATTLLITPSRRRGCILTTWTWERFTHKRILRSELLALLLQLEVAGNRAARRGVTCIGVPVFILSFTCTQARIVEARIEKPDLITVSIREVLKQLPYPNERDQTMQRLIAWSMFTDGDSEPDVTAERAGTANNEDNGSDDTDRKSGRDEGTNTSDTSNTSHTQKSKRSRIFCGLF